MDSITEHLGLIFFKKRDKFVGIGNVVINIGEKFDVRTHIAYDLKGNYQEAYLDFIDESSGKEYNYRHSAKEFS